MITSQAFQNVANSTFASSQIQVTKYSIQVVFKTGVCKGMNAQIMAIRTIRRKEGREVDYRTDDSPPFKGGKRWIDAK